MSNGRPVNQNTDSTKTAAGPGRGPMGRAGMGGHGGMRGLMTKADKPSDFLGALRKLLRYLGAYKWAILAVWTFAIVATILATWGPKILGKATDVLFNGVMQQIAGTGSIAFERIGQILLFLLSIYLVSALLSFVQGYIMSGVSMNITYRLRRDIMDKLHRLPFKYYDKTPHGEVLSRITNDVDLLSSTLSQSITQIITAITSIIAITVMMLSISWQLTLLTLLMLPLSLVIIAIIVRKSQGHFANRQKYLGHVNGHIEEMFGAHLVVKAFNGEEQSIEQFDEYNETLYHSAWKASFLSNLMMPIINFIGNSIYVAVCLLGGYLITTGAMTVGGIQAFIQYVRSFTQPISQIASISNVLQQTAAAAERVFELLEEEEEIPEENNDFAVTGSVCFEDVTFGYDADKPVIRNFNACVNPGQKIAIVGPTGAGKTTLVKLLMRFYDVDAGAITIDGNDIRLFRRNDLRGLFGMVLQETWLFNGTIADNIRYGKLTATDDEVVAAAQAAQVDHFVRTLPDGYQMELNEEADNISQGQKQLLTIARAILADPDMLILDEATSSVDTRTEILIQQAMDNLMEGRTSFVIAHRLSTIRNADLILVIDQGDIVEQGSHDELLERGGFYANLYHSQFEYGKIG